MWYDYVAQCNIKHFSGTHSRNVMIITNMNGWSEEWITPIQDCVIIRSNLTNQTIYIMALYFNPMDIPVSEFRLRVSEIHKRLRSIKSQRLLILGDLNCRSPLWSPDEGNAKGEIFINACIHLRLCAVVDPCSEMGKVNRSTGSLTWVDAFLCDRFTFYFVEF